VETHLFFARDPAPASGFKVSGAAVQWVESSDSPRAAALAVFCAAGGFSTSWAIEMLAAGARAVVSLDPPTGEITGMGWMTTRQFFVGEVAAHLALPPDAAYLFGGFVAPAFRGRRLHRLLVGARLDRLCELDLRAITICHTDNQPSIRSNLDEGYRPILQYQHWHWRRWRHRRAIPAEGATARQYDLVFEPGNVVRLIARIPLPRRVRPAA
jgi:Acetyltransferase (GNAT) family